MGRAGAALLQFCFSFSFSFSAIKETKWVGRVLRHGVVTAHESAAGSGMIWSAACSSTAWCNIATLTFATDEPPWPPIVQSNGHGQHSGNHLRKKEVVMQIPFLLGGLCGG
jgi:hypothetical protein